MYVIKEAHLVEKTKRDIKYDLLAYRYYKQLEKQEVNIDEFDEPSKQIFLQAEKCRKEYISNAETLLKKLKSICKEKDYNLFKEYFVEGKSVEELQNKYGFKQSAFLMKSKRMKDSLMGEHRVYRYDSYSYLTATEKKEIFDGLCNSYKRAWELLMEAEKEIAMYFRAMVTIKNRSTSKHQDADEHGFLVVMEKKEFVERQRQCLLDLIEYIEKVIGKVSNTNYSIIQYQVYRSMLEKGYKEEFLKVLDLSSNYRVWIVKAADQIFDERLLVAGYKKLDSLNDIYIEELKLEKVKLLLDKVTAHKKGE